MADACFGLALNCKIVGAFNEAYIWLDLGKSKSTETEALCRAELLRGILKKDEGKFREALELHLEIAPLFEHLDNDILRAVQHLQHAIIRRKIGTAEKAPEQFDFALIEYTGAGYHFEKAGDFRSATIVKNNKAFLLFKIERYEEALREVNGAIADYLTLKDRPNLAQARETKAQILLALDRLDEAEFEARTSCDLLRMGGERALLVESLITHARCLARMAQKAKAFRTFQMAQDVAEFIEFGHGLGLISLAILEEFDDLDIDTRRAHHKVVKEKLAVDRDAELAERHETCAKITVEMFAAEVSVPDPKGKRFKEGFSLNATVLAFERTLIECALEDASGCQKEAARLLGISASNLNHKLKTQHKPIKNLQTYGHYNGVKCLKHINTLTMPNDALSGLGINEGDELVLKQGCRMSVGDVVLVRSRRKLYVGIYGQEPGKMLLGMANPNYKTWEFREGTFEFESKVVGYIPKDEVGQPHARVRELPNPYPARSPAS